MTNLYASRVSSESPLETWPLDDGASFVSLISEYDRDFSGDWSITNGLASIANTSDPIAIFPKSVMTELVPNPATGSVGASESIDLTLAINKTADDTFSSVPVAISLYVWMSSDYATSIDIGSSSATDHYTRNAISSSIVDSWVKVQSSNVDLTDGNLFVRINLKEGELKSGIVFYLNGLAVGQSSEPYTSETLGAHVSKNGVYIKGISLDPSMTQYSGLIEASSKTGANCITVPIKINIPTTTSNEVSIDDDSYDFAKIVYANHHKHKKILLEPYPWINGGANTPEELNPSVTADWFDAWKKSLDIIINDMPKSWGIYMGTKMDLMEAETAEWESLSEFISARFEGNILYKTRWWTTDVNTPSTITDYQTNKRDLALWEFVDMISVAAFFELTETNDPDQSEIEAALRSVTIGAPDREQDVFSEVMALHDTWGKPVLLGEVSCPSLNDGAYQPWNSTVSATPNANIQDRLVSAYQNVFYGANGYSGFSVPFGSGDIYEPEDNTCETIVSAVLSPYNNFLSELTPAQPYSPTYSNVVLTNSGDVVVHDLADHFVDGDTIVLKSVSGSSGLNVNQAYFVTNSTKGQFQVSEVQGGPAAEITSDQTAKLLKNTPSAFYVSRNKRLMAKETAIPMVYGTKHLIRMESFSNTAEPSLIFDGQGMFNKSGMGSDYTAEFWYRSHGTAMEPRKIFGPVEGADGVYISGGNIFLNIAGSYDGEYLGNLSGPTLISVRLHDTRADVVVNGDILVSLQVDYDNAVWPDATNTMLGLYSYFDLGPVEVSSPSVFGYIVSEVVSKKRFAWGQGVGDLDLTATSYGGVTAQPSFASSSVAKSASYPDNYNWGAGTFENLFAQNNKLSVIDRPEPNVILSGGNKTRLLGTASVDSSTNTVTINSHGLSNQDSIRLSNISGPTTVDSDSEYYVISVDQTSFKLSPRKNSTTIVNLDVSGTADITVIDYSKKFDYDEWVADNAKQSSDSMSMVPDEDWSIQSGYMYFDKLSKFIDSPRAILFTWKSDTLSGEETLVQLRSRSDYQKYVRAYLDNTDVKVEFVDGDDTTLLSTQAVSTSNYYTLCIDLMSDSYGETLVPSKMKTLLRSTGDVELLVAGTESIYNDASDTFSGTIKAVSLMSPNQFKTVEALFAGHPVETLDYAALSASEQHAIGRSTYTYEFFSTIGPAKPSVAQVGYWEDYIPLSSLSGFVEDYKGDKAAAIDSLQINVSAVRPDNILKSATQYAAFDELWGIEGDTYAEFAARYPGMLYSDLDAILHDEIEAAFGLVSGEYDELVELLGFSSETELLEYLYNKSSVGLLDTSSSDVRVFASFQSATENMLSLPDLSDGPTTSIDSTIYYDADGIANYEKIEVLDGTTIIPPRSQRIDKLVLSLHIEIAARDVGSRPIGIKSLEVASMAQPRNAFSELGSRSGTKVYAFADNGIYYDHSIINPYRVDKRGYPYLQLGRESGYVPVGKVSSSIDRGISVPIQERRYDTSYELGLMQFWMKRDTGFPTVAAKIFEYDDFNSRIGLFLAATPSDPTTGTVFALDQDDNPVTTISLFQNGLEVANPIISVSEWNSIAIKFKDRHVPSSTVPLMKIYPGATYNNLSYFKPNPSSTTALVPQEWGSVDNETWEHWTLDGSYESNESSWYNLLFPGQSVSKEESWAYIVHSAYVGANVEDVYSTKPLTFYQAPISAHLMSAQYRHIVVPT